MRNFIGILKRLLIIPGTFDPDDLRRRRVLNILLIFLLFVIVALLLVIGWNENWEIITDNLLYNPEAGYVISAFSLFVLFTMLLGLNRWKRTPPNLVGWIFILFVVFFASLADSPRELINGRSIFVWALPITLSVVVLPPASVFVVDFFITILFIYWGNFRYETIQVFTIAQVYIVSFISWLGMSIAERAIRDARNESGKNSAILEGVAEGVLVLGPNDQIILANRAASELMGNETTGITPATESAEIAGRTLSFRWSQVDGVGWVAIVRDVSRQIEIDRAKDAVLRVVSHEMRTPLAAILGFTEALASRSNSDMLERIRANAQRMMTLVNDLLDQAYIEAGVLKMHNENFSSNSLAKAIRDAFYARAEKKQIAFNVVIADSLPEILIGDLHRYQQILANLVDNAIKFTNEGGCVDVLLAPGDDVGKWQMIVRDTGIGILPERLPDIFLPFRRASDYATRSHQGVGLGLSIAKRIAQLAHGNIEVKSMAGHGSTFTVTLPIMEVPDEGSDRRR